MRVSKAKVDFSGSWRDIVRRRLKNEAAVTVGGGEDGASRIDFRTRIKRSVGVAMLILFWADLEALLEECRSGRWAGFGPSSISASRDRG